MNEHLARIKALLDAAVKAGLFQKSEDVVAMHNSVGYLTYAVESFERVGDEHPTRNVAGLKELTADRSAGKPSAMPIPGNGAQKETATSEMPV